MEKKLNHKFFEDGATLFVISGEIVILYTIEDPVYGVWFTTRVYKNDAELTAFLDECVEGKHSDLGTGCCGTYREMMNQIKAIE